MKKAGGGGAEGVGEVLWPWHRRFGSSTCGCRGAGPGEEGWACASVQGAEGYVGLKAKLSCQRGKGWVFTFGVT